MANQKVTVLDVKKAKEEGRKLVMMTAYDYPFGLMADEAGVDIVLVGDSLGMVVMGLEGTVEVGMEHMIHHIKAVVRGCKGPLIVGDMPFMSYNISIRDAIQNAGRLMKEGGCEVIKLEGGVDFAPTIQAIVKVRHGYCPLHSPSRRLFHYAPNSIFLSGTKSEIAQHFAQQPSGDELDAQNHGQHADHQQRAGANRRDIGPAAYFTHQP